MPRHIRTEPIKNVMRAPSLAVNNVLKGVKAFIQALATEPTPISWMVVALPSNTPLAKASEKTPIQNLSKEVSRNLRDRRDAVYIPQIEAEPNMTKLDRKPATAMALSATQKINQSNAIRLDAVELTSHILRRGWSQRCSRAVRLCLLHPCLYKTQNITCSYEFSILSHVLHVLLMKLGW